MQNTNDSSLLTRRRQIRGPDPSPHYDLARIPTQGEITPRSGLPRPSCHQAVTVRRYSERAIDAEEKKVERRVVRPQWSLYIYSVHIRARPTHHPDRGRAGFLSCAASDLAVALPLGAHMA